MILCEILGMNSFHKDDIEDLVQCKTSNQK